MRGAGDDGVMHQVVNARERFFLAVHALGQDGCTERAGRRQRHRELRSRVRAARRERRQARALHRSSLEDTKKEGMGVRLDVKPPWTR